MLKVIFNVEMNIHEKGYFFKIGKLREIKVAFYDDTMWHVCNAWKNMTPKILLCMLTLEFMTTHSHWFYCNFKNQMRRVRDFLINDTRMELSVEDDLGWYFLNNFSIMLLKSNLIVNIFNFQRNQFNNFLIIYFSSLNNFIWTYQISSSTWFDNSSIFLLHIYLHNILNSSSFW